MATNGQTGVVGRRTGSETSAGRMGRDLVALGCAVTVGLVSCAAFLPVLENRFVDQWDDQANFLTNQAFRGLGWPQIRWAGTTILQGAYQPIAWILFEAEYVTWGLDPRGYHLASLLLHAANAVLFYLLIRALVSHAHAEIEPGRRWVIDLMSGLAAALFAVHPLRVEVVAWASCQPYLPCAGFAILSVLAYLRGCASGRRRPGWLFAAVGLFAAALCCKAAALALPVVLLILDVLVIHRASSRRSIRGALAEKVLFLIPAIAIGQIALKAKFEPLPNNDFRPGLARIVAGRVALAGYGLGYYLNKTVWPRGLSAYHYRPDPVEPSQPRFTWSLAAVGSLGVIAYLLRRRWPSILAAALAYAALLAPNLGLVWYDLMLVADRYSYLATMPLFVLVAGGLVRWVTVSRRPRTLALLIAATEWCLIAISIAVTWAQCATWRNSESLVAHGLRVGSGRDGFLESNFGLDLLASGRVEEGMVHLHRAIRIDPADPDVHENLGIIMARRGDLAGAIVPLAEAVRLAPYRFELRHHLGVALANCGRLEESAEQLAATIRLHPEKAKAHISFGDVLAKLGRYDEAAAQYTEAIRLDRDNAGALQALGRLGSRVPKP